jgi:hypothetical protein
MSLILSPLFVIALLAAGVQQNASAPSLDRPCSFVSASDMTTLIGTKVSAANDEKFRCKYVVEKGWLETKLMDASLKISRDIYDYNRAHGKPVAGVGDQAYALGATLAARLGDVLVVVDGSNVPKAPDNAKLAAIAVRIIKQIP